MRKILNEKVVIEIPSGLDHDGKQAFKTSEKTIASLIWECTNRMLSPKEGLSYDDIEKIETVRNAVLVKEGEEIRLEEADYAFVKNRVDTMKWIIASMELVNFRNKIREAPKV